MQKIMLIGNLGADPERLMVNGKLTQSGKKLVKFSLAVAVTKEKVTWYEITIWEEKLAGFEAIIKFLRKGSRVAIIGNLQPPHLYKNREGNPSVKLIVNPLSIDFVGAPKEKEADTEKKENQEEFPF